MSSRPIVAWSRRATVLRRHATGACLAVVLAGCASATTRTEEAPAGRVGVVTIVLTASVRREPLSATDLADSETAAAVASCERSGGGTSCKEHWVLGDPQDRFSRDANERLHVVVALTDLEPRRRYECTIRLFDPDGGLVARLTKRLQSPDSVHPKHRMTFVFDSATGTMRPGRWKVEIAVNGDVEGERTFEVVGSARVQPPAAPPSASPAARLSAPASDSS
jgi:hypothetical protein